ncbi:MAG: homocysteine S-methyltransferase family protein [Bacteroidota bacterium]
MTAHPFARALQEKRPLILDGAMGTELQRRGVDTGLPLWSARSLKTSPGVVLAVHREYIEAGSDIITTNTFRTTRRTFLRARLPDESALLTERATEIARQAREAFPDRHILLAGSMAPLEDCYRPDLVPPRDELEEEHGELANRLARAGVDFILLETMGTLREITAACAAACATGREVVVSFLCDARGNLYGGEPMEKAVEAITPLGPAAVSLNCASVRHLPAAMDRLVRSTPLPFGVYGNVGLPEQERGWEFTRDVLADEYALHATRWQEAGASFIGGCCGTTPAYIRMLVRALHATDRGRVDST